MCLVTQSCPTLCNPMDCSPPGSTVHGDSPGTNIRVGCYALLQGIFPTEVLKPGLLHCRQIFLPSELLGKPINMFNILKNLIFQYSIHREILYTKYVILLCLTIWFTLALFSELYSLLRVFYRALVQTNKRNLFVLSEQTNWGNFEGICYIKSHISYF